MKNRPSRKALEAAFPGKGKILRKLLTSKQAVLEHPAAQARERECYHPPGLADMRLHALNAALETFGVEYVQAGHNAKSPAFNYLNTGDSYAATIIRFSDGRYRISSWGDIVERGNYD